MKINVLSGGIAGLLTAGVALVAAPLLTTPAVAVPGTPTVPQPGEVVFAEDFEGKLQDGRVTPLLSFDGVDGQSYTAEGSWALPSDWNGIVLDPTSTNEDIAATGAGGGYTQMRALAQSLGTLNGNGAQNHAVTAYTAGNPGANLVEFATWGPIAPSAPVDGRFLTFSVNVAAINCEVSAPLFNFFFDDGSTELALNDDPIDGCANGDGASTVIADEPVLWTADENPRLVMRNANGSGVGNDHAYDDIRVLDVSPQLDKQFVPGVTSAGSTARVRFTVTNTAELAAKPGWSFADSLPLPVAAEPNFATTCTDGEITGGGDPGDTTISLAGDLDATQTHCTFEIDLATPDDAEEGDTWTNAAADLSDVVGLKPPADATLAIGERLFGECSDLVTFDAGPESWRVASTTDGTTPNAGYPLPIGWDAMEGNPGGALTTDDVDGQWTEIWSPDLSGAGFTDAYGFLDGGLVQFDYRNDTGIGFNLYLSIRGTNGDQIWFNFAPQITNSQAWNRVRVPMDAAEWHTGFSTAVGTDLGSPAPTQAEFEAILASVDRFVVSAEGRVGQDLTFLDNFGQPCDDLGDAPSSYGTSWDGENGASHRVTGLDPATDTASLMLGSLVDVEDDGFPGAGANGDDVAGVADEDGVPYPIAVVDGEATPVTVTATNDTSTGATLAGWLDLDDDGTFETGERVTVAVPANSGTASYSLTFPAMVGTSAETFARFRLFAGAVGDPLPTGPANGGEVEDHAVVLADPAMTIAKTAQLQDSNGNLVADLGETILYAFEVVNTGNIVLADVSVDDPKVPAASGEVLAALQPGASHVFGSVAYTVTQADVDAGSVVNEAVARATVSGGGSVDSPPSRSTVDTPERVGGLSIIKNADLDDRNGNGVADEGETIDYTFLVSNTGNVTMIDIVVVDDMVTGLTPSGFDLAPRGTQTVAAEPYVVTAADVLRGTITNTAYASGVDPLGNQVSSDFSTITTPSVDPVLPGTGSAIGLWVVAAGLVLIAAGGASMTVVNRRRTVLG